MISKNKTPLCALDLLDDALGFKPTFTPYLMCACGCLSKINPNRATWLGNLPYVSKKHASR